MCLTECLKGHAGKGLAGGVPLDSVCALICRRLLSMAEIERCSAAVRVEQHLHTVSSVLRSATAAGLACRSDDRITVLWVSPAPGL